MLSPVEVQQHGPLVSFTDVSHEVHGKPILNDFTLSLSDRRVGVVGRNGSGKSTLCRLLSGLDTPTTGRITVDSINLARDRRQALKKVGVLFQNPDHQIIFPTVGEELAFGLKQMGMTKAEVVTGVNATLDRFGKRHWIDANIHTLSQGQKQLVCVMAIFAMSPRIIILDEPFSGLDIPTRMMLECYIDALDCMVFHVSHDPQDLKSCDRVLWIDEGHLQMDGRADDVLTAYLKAMHEIGGRDDIINLTS